MKPVKVARGVKENVEVSQKEPFTYIDTTGADLKGMKRKVVMEKKLEAPVKKGDKVGEAVYYLNDAEVGRRDIVADETVGKISYQSALVDAAKGWML